MIVAGIGCRRGCPAEAIVALVREAGPVDALAAPAWKQGEAGLLEAARILALPLRFIPLAELAFAIPLHVTRLPTRTHVAPVEWPAVAEGCATSSGGTLVVPRINNATATCALGNYPQPGPLPPAGEAAVIRWWPPASVTT